MCIIHSIAQVTGEKRNATKCARLHILSQQKFDIHIWKIKIQIQVKIEEKSKDLLSNATTQIKKMSNSIKNV